MDILVFGLLCSSTAVYCIALWFLYLDSPENKHLDDERRQAIEEFHSNLNTLETRIERDKNNFNNWIR